MLTSNKPKLLSGLMHRYYSRTSTTFPPVALSNEHIHFYYMVVIRCNMICNKIIFKGKRFMLSSESFVGIQCFQTWQLKSKSVIRTFDLNSYKYYRTVLRKFRSGSKRQKSWKLSNIFWKLMKPTLYFKWNIYINIYPKLLKLSKNQQHCINC